MSTKKVQREKPEPVIERVSITTGDPQATAHLSYGTKRVLDPTLPVDISLAAGEEHRQALNEALASGEPVTMQPGVISEMGAVMHSPEVRHEAYEKFIRAGILKAMVSVEGHDIVSVTGFRAAIEALMRHLHEDHPENYLP